MPPLRRGEGRTESMGIQSFESESCKKEVCMREQLCSSLPLTLAEEGAILPQITQQEKYILDNSIDINRTRLKGRD